MRVPGKVPTPEGSIIMPTVLGGTNWYPPSLQSVHRIVLSFGVGEHRNAIQVKDGRGAGRTADPIPWRK